MASTFVYDGLGKKSARTAVGYGQFGQVDDSPPMQIPGGGGVYSTVDDLFKWDQALYAQKLVRQSTLAEAFTPGTVEEGHSTYGFGWNVAEDGSGRYVWHTGSEAGFRAFIERRLGPRITVILLTNRGNSKRMEINAAIQNIFAAKPFVLPKRSGAEKLYSAIHDSGIQAALKTFHDLKAGKDANYDFGESELNTLGYRLLYGDKESSDAVAIFRLNTSEHPESSNAFDSLGEAYSRNGQRGLAVQSYQTAVKLDPTNGHAASMLRLLAVPLAAQPADRLTGKNVSIAQTATKAGVRSKSSPRQTLQTPLRMPSSRTCHFVTARSKWIWPANRPLVRAVAPAGSLASRSGSRLMDATSTSISDAPTAGPTIRSGGITPLNTVHTLILTSTDRGGRLLKRTSRTWICSPVSGPPTGLRWKAATRGCT